MFSKIEWQGLSETAMFNEHGVHSRLDLFMRKCELPFENSKKYLKMWESESEAEVLLL